MIHTVAMAAVLGAAAGALAPAQAAFVPREYKQISLDGLLLGESNSPGNALMVDSGTAPSGWQLEASLRSTIPGDTWDYAANRLIVEFTDLTLACRSASGCLATNFGFFYQLELNVDWWQIPSDWDQWQISMVGNGPAVSAWLNGDSLFELPEGDYSYATQVVIPVGTSGNFGSLLQLHASLAVGASAEGTTLHLPNSFRAALGSLPDLTPHGVPAPSSIALALAALLALGGIGVHKRRRR